MSKPSKTQINADKFDASLFALLFWATSNSANKGFSKSERHAWDIVRMHLGEARPFVRAMMHPERVKETSRKP
jgi:hypothetical protein